MIDSDGEWYLRRRAEDELLAHGPSTLAERARALTAVGLVSDDVAREIIGTYGRARTLRALGGFEDDVAWGSSERPAEDLVAPRIRPCGRTVDHPGGTVTLHYLVWRPDETRIAVTVTDSSGGMQAYANYARHGPLNPTVTDDRGRTHSTDFSGGGSDRQWDGYFVLSPPLREGTGWITMLGTRIELGDAPSDVTVRVETVARDAPVPVLAERHLARCVTSGDRWREQDEVRCAAETFVDCGVIERDSPMVREALAVASALRDRAAPPGQLSPAWGAVAARLGRADGPSGRRVVGATTPVFDDVRVVVLALDSHRSHFGFAFEAAGALGIDRHGLPALTITAADDRGNRYLGELGSHGSGSDGVEGDVVFHASLDPAATTLDILFETDRAQATISVPLSWDGPA